MLRTLFVPKTHAASILEPTSGARSLDISGWLTDTYIFSWQSLFCSPRGYPGADFAPLLNKNIIFFLSQASRLDCVIVRPSLETVQLSPIADQPLSDQPTSRTANERQPISRSPL
jgi:hypothetical protein